MGETKKIEFYKHRKLGETLTEAMNFIQYNAKPIFKNLALVALPIALVTAYFSKNQFQNSISSMMLGAGDLSSYMSLMAGNLAISLLISLIAYSAIYGMLAEMMNKYTTGELTGKTTLSDLSANWIPLSLKTLGMNCLLIIITAAVVAFFTLLSNPLGMWIFFLLAIVLFTIAVPVSLVYYPMYFKKATILESLSEGIQIGFRKWGATFAVLLVTGLFMYLVISFLSIPYYLCLFFNQMVSTGSVDMGGVGLFSFADLTVYISSFILSFGTFMIIPFIFIPLAFLYFSAREENEAVSVESEIEHFEEI